MPATMVVTGHEYTVKNLLVSYEGEVNAQARYKTFADKADAEGLAGIASLFRTTARAEQIHANNQARLLRKMGAEARAHVGPFKNRATLDNLKTALAGERYEIGAMYPGFIEEATGSLNSNAARAFIWALEAEKTHERLFSTAIADVEKNEAGSWIYTPRDFQVCPVCAYTAENREADNCVVCNYPWEMFETIR
jgi:rubrerythrin